MVKLVICIVAIIAAVTALPSHQQWNDFKLKHKKVYSDPQEELLRFNIFNDNLEKIKNHNDRFNAGLETYKMGVTRFTDMPKSEFLEHLTLSGPNPLTKGTADIYQAPKDFILPKSVDYRKQNAVNPVKDQKQCGSCWAFSAVGSLESINFLKTKKLLSLSEQNLVDCSQNGGNEGCNGGNMIAAYDYIRDNGLETEDDYPYQGIDQECKFSLNKSVVAITGYANISEGSEQDLQTALVNVGPIAIAVDGSYFHNYHSGIIYTNNTFFTLNHGVVLIGYGDQNGEEYYIVRNSWGADWGEEGYVRVARNKHNQLGIADAACYPKPK